MKISLLVISDIWWASKRGTLVPSQCKLVLKLERVSPYQTDALGLTCHSLSHPVTLLSFFSKGKPWMQGKLADTCSSCTSPPFWPALLKILRTGLGYFCTCPFPLQPSQRESILLSCKRLLQQEMLGRSTWFQCCYHKRETSYPLFLLSLFLKELETNHLTK